MGLQTAPDVTAWDDAFEQHQFAPQSAMKLVFQAASDNNNVTFKPYVFHLAPS